uniref:Uncharacterized protein n=1 Tax=Peronospora matthiolae TaxID=2874970 RepID=A0AAV1UZ59_9STRA
MWLHLCPCDGVLSAVIFQLTWFVLANPRAVKTSAFSLAKSTLSTRPVWVHRLELRALRIVMDLATILSDQLKLQHLVNDLFRPFDALQVDQVVALQVEPTITLDVNHRISANRNSLADDFAISTCHGTTTAIAGAIAGAKELAYGEVSVLKKKHKKKRQKKDEEDEKGEEREVTVELKEEDAVLVAKMMGDASTCLSTDDGNGAFSVELKRETISETARILLVADLVNEVESILAARNALSRIRV